MKKSLVLLASGFLLIMGCNKSGSNDENPPSENLNSEQISGRHCASYDVLQDQLKADPSLAKRMNDIEEFTKRIIENPSAYRLLPDGTIEIPVWVNVLYKTSAENISIAQIQSQIDVLNEDYGATNIELSQFSYFSSRRAGNTNIRFAWNTSNVTRKATNKTSWRTDDSMKKSSRGGIDPTSPTNTLNIWVCNLSSGLLGYAQFPGGSLSTDGVVCDNNAFGRGNYSLYTAFNKGRTTTHEVGHWLNLRHIWGDDGSGCTGSDQVTDTPNQADENYGCPTFPQISCSNSSDGGDMFMNYMDYTDDACMYMFTAGQKARMLATFSAARSGFAQP
jgi:hypothetical protein